MLMVVALVMELGNIYVMYDSLEMKLQRVVNSAVEYSMLDDYRADRILQLNGVQAQQTLNEYLTTDLGINASGVHYEDGKQQYQIVITSTDIDSTNPSITIKGTVYINTIFTLFVSNGRLDFPFEIKSSNFRIEG